MERSRDENVASRSRRDDSQVRSVQEPRQLAVAVAEVQRSPADDPRRPRPDTASITGLSECSCPAGVRVPIVASRSGRSSPTMGAGRCGRRRRADKLGGANTCVEASAPEESAHMATAITGDAVIRDIVETMRRLAGPHPGFRPVHAKGLVCSGTFRASPEAPRISRAPHFAGPPVATTIRFANGSGKPDAHDGAPAVRSMAVKLALPDGKSADILANSVDGFVARTPEELLEFLRAQLSDAATGRPDPQALPRFL